MVMQMESVRLELKLKPEVEAWRSKKYGFSMIYKKDKEDLDRTMAQYSNNIITSYEAFDVLHHNFNNSAAVVECHKVKRNCDDYDGVGLVEKEASMMYHTRKGQKGSQNLWPMVTVAIVLKAGSERPVQPQLDLQLVR